MKRIETCAFALLITVVLGGCDLLVSTDARLERATKATAAGNLALASIELRKAIQKEPENGRARLLLAGVAMRAGDPVAALRELGAARERGIPADQLGALEVEARLAMGQAKELLVRLNEGALGLDAPARAAAEGRAKAMLGDADGARAAFDDALAADPRSLDARLGRAELLAEQSEWNDALSEVDAALAAAPDSAAALGLKARLLMRVGQYAEASRLFDQARAVLTQLDVPRQAMLLSHAVEARLAQGQVDEASRALTELKARAPEAPVVELLGARVALARGDNASAIAGLQRLLAKRPDHVPARLLLGAAQLSQGSLSQAESQLAQVVQAAPDNLEARKLLARVRLQLDQPEQAVRVLTPALDAETGDPQLFALLGAAELQSGQSGLAIGALERSVSRNPDHTSLKLDLAGAYLAANRATDARKLLEASAEGDVKREALLIVALAAEKGPAAARAGVERLLRDRPGDPEALNLAASYFGSQREFERARALLQQSSEISPERSATFLGLARVELAAGDLASAEAALRKALASSPADSTIRIALADTIYRRGDKDGAAEVLKLRGAAGEGKVDDALASPELALALAQVEFGRADVAAANRAIEAAIDASPEASAQRAGVLVAAGRLLLENSSFDAALARFRAASEMNPDDPLTWYGAGRAQLAMNDPSAARGSLSRALEVRPGFVPAIAALTLMDVRAGKLDAARARVREARAQAQKEVALITLAGDIEMAAREFATAAKIYAEATRVRPDASLAVKDFAARRAATLRAPEEPLTQWLAGNPEDHRVRTVLAEYWLNEGVDAKAIAEFEAVRRQVPGSPALLNNLAWLYQRQDDPRARALAEQARELAPQAPAIADTLGWILMEEGQTDRALPLLAEAASAMPESAEIQYHYASALAASGRSKDALVALDRALNEKSFASRREAENLRAQLVP